MYTATGFQDRWVLSVLGEKTNGFFVEAGGLDGIEQSNTYVLEKHFGWSGIVIEPTPSLFEQMEKNRTCYCENSCLAESSRQVDFVVADGLIRGLGGMIECIRHPQAVDLKRTIRLETTTLFQLLKKYDAPFVIDYLSLDVEGSEYLVLKNFPFEIYSFRCISVETSDCNELLLSQGYELVKNPLYKDVCEMFFVKPDLL